MAYEHRICANVYDESASSNVKYAHKKILIKKIAAKLYAAFFYAKKARLLYILLLTFLFRFQFQLRMTHLMKLKNHDMM